MDCRQSSLPIMENQTLLIVPPFASSYRPALGVHVLQAVARQQGHQVRVLYANLMFAAILGEQTYHALCEYDFMAFLGERIMAWHAFPGQVNAPDLNRFNQQSAAPISLDQLQNALNQWQQQLSHCLQQQRFDCIGVSSTFEQTNASLLVMRTARALWPDATLVMGGANCEGEMASGMLAYIPQLDHVFAGEAELVFADFLSQPAAFAGQKIIRGAPNQAINQLPANDYDDYFAQFDQWLPASPRRGTLELTYESSRGCWWGQKNHCTFCGLNGQGMGFREKNPETVFNELMALQQQYHLKRVLMVDNIMPHGYFKTLLPRLALARSGLQIFYEQKANIDLAQAILLKQAGVEVIQPGIEALSSPLLRLMKKGVRAKQNLALLRYAKAVNIQVQWNLLYGFPGEQADWFAPLLQALPALEHLQPPTGIHPINIDRFSPFFTRPDELGFTQVRPHPAYQEIFPAPASLTQLAYHFCADANTPTLADSALLAPLQQGIQDWHTAWQQTQRTPTLAIMALSDEQYLLIDSRQCALAPNQIISKEQAAACLVEQSSAKASSAATAWALAQRAALAFDGCIVPLATAEPQLLLRFEQAALSGKHAVMAIKASAA